jgi:Ribonuclease G/E
VSAPALHTHDADALYGLHQQIWIVVPVRFAISLTWRPAPGDGDWLVIERGVMRHYGRDGARLLTISDGGVICRRAATEEAADAVARELDAAARRRGSLDGHYAVVPAATVTLLESSEPYGTRAADVAL